jgi:hypothetical protein
MEIVNQRISRIESIFYKCYFYARLFNDFSIFSFSLKNNNSTCVKSQVIITFLAKWTIYIMIEENSYWTNVEYFFSINHSILFIVLLSSRFDADSDLSLSFNLDQIFRLTDQNTEKEIWISFRLKRRVV